MIVTNSRGRTKEPADPKKEGDTVTNLAGTYAYVYKDDSQTKDPYRFWAAEIPDQPDGEGLEVIMVIPLGGEWSGLYRYPRIGEEVLVGIQETGGWGVVRYLMGYLPTTSNPFNTGKAGVEDTAEVLDRQGEVFRYRQTGKKEGKEGDEPYSEIGFYSRQAQWPTNDFSYNGVSAELPGRLDEKDNKLDDKAYSALLVAGGYPKKDQDESDAAHIYRITTPTVFPAIDQINIHSTGDIHTAAKNHQRLKAKRFELLVDCKKDTIHNKKKLEKDELPLGDNPGDDSVLHAGDAHIRANNRVVIKAGEEIILQVGKTVLKISDSGFDVISKVVNSNITNGFDATLRMSGKSGISLFGLDLDINSNKSFSMGDAFGGGISSSLGVVSIGGREIKAEVYDSTQFLMTMAFALINYAQSTKAGAEGIQGKVPSYNEVFDYAEQSVQILMSLYKLYEKISGLRKKWKNLTKAKEEAAKEAAKKAEEAALEAAKNADKKAEEANKAAEDEAAATKAKADADLLDGKITAKEAEDIKADADAKEVKAKADAEAERLKTKAEGEAVEKKRAADEERDAKQNKADIDAAQAMDLADKDAEAAKEEAENEANKTKREAAAAAEAEKAAADAEAANTKKNIDDAEAAGKAAIDRAVANGSMTREEGEKEKKSLEDDSNEERAKADAERDDKRDKADMDAQLKRKQANEERDNKRDKADMDAAKARENAEAEADNKKKQAEAEADNKKKQADADADNKKKQADADADDKKKQADADAAAKKGQAAGGGAGSGTSSGAAPGSSGGTGNPPTP
jgi:hypothetical protein